MPYPCLTLVSYAFSAFGDLKGSQNLFLADPPFEESEGKSAGSSPFYDHWNILRHRISVKTLVVLGPDPNEIVRN